MKLFLVTDIFGRTPALEAIGEELSHEVFDLEIVDPYEGTHHCFETEAAAYDHFMDLVGLKKYASILAETLPLFGPDIVLIGFSVGASAIWEVSDRSPFAHIKKAVCFYGSQIRQKTHLHPVFDIDLIFPKHEPHFDVDDLIRDLQRKDRITCTKSKGLHGFMNKLSTHFDPACYTDCIRDLKASLAQLEI